jgi:DNA polymerase-1
MFSTEQESYDLAILIKNKAMIERELITHYIQPLEDLGIARKQVVALSLEMSDTNKVTAQEAKECLANIGSYCKQKGIRHVLVADAFYFKTACKVKKAEPHYGYVLPAPLISPGVQATLSVNYQQLFYNPSLKSRLVMGLNAVANSICHKPGLFANSILINASYPETIEDISRTLQELHSKPALTCDIETLGLKPEEQRSLVSIAFAWDKYSGIAFMLNNYLPSHRTKIKQLLKKFFLQYKGTLIFHNATFDTKNLIHFLFMKNPSDLTGMLEGLHCLYRKLDDTKLLAYLASNTTANNSLSLKDLAFEFAGKYSLDSFDFSVCLNQKEILEYNLTDCAATWYVYEVYREKVRQEQEWIYQSLMLSALKTITQMELTGMAMSKSAIDRLAENLQRDMRKVAQDIADHPIVQQFTRELRIAAAIEHTARLKKTIKTEEDYADLKFNPGSNKHLAKLLFDHLALPVFRYTDTNAPSVDEKSLNSLIGWIRNQLPGDTHGTTDPASGL